MAEQVILGTLGVLAAGLLFWSNHVYKKSLPISLNDTSIDSINTAYNSPNNFLTFSL